MEPIICSCGETISDKYEDFKQMYSNPFNTSFDKVCEELAIHKLCTKITFQTTLQKEDIKNIQNFIKVEKDN